MSRIKFLLAVGCLCLGTAMVFTSCGGVDDEDDPPRQVSSSSGAGSPPDPPQYPEIDEPCDTEYNPLTHFCKYGQVKERCGNEEYDWRNRFCFENKFYLKCGGLEYDSINPNSKYSYNPLLQFCSGETLYLRCNGKERDPENEFCFDEKTVVPKCMDGTPGGEIFNPDEQFCLSQAHLGLNDMLVKKCDGNEYYPSEQFCGKDKKLYARCFGGNNDPDGLYDTKNLACCAGTLMDSKTKFCFEEEKKPYDKCNGETYHPNYQFPKGTGSDCTIESLCDGKEYNTSTHFCSTADKILELCDNPLRSYEPSTHFCSNIDRKIYLKCSGKDFDTDNKFCSDGKTVDFCNIGTTSSRKDTLYTPDVEFCGRNFSDTRDSVIVKCDGSEYDFPREFCRGVESYTRCFTGNADLKGEYTSTNSCCAGTLINSIDNFCFEENSYKKCNRETYNPPSDTCATDWKDPTKERIYQKLCGGEVYDYQKRFCSGNRFYLFCDNEKYDPLTQFCHRVTTDGVTTEKIHPRCGGNEKDNPETEFCFDGKPVLFCNDEGYNPDEQVCGRNQANTQDSLIAKPKCGGNDILSTEFCVEGKPYPRCGTQIDAVYGGLGEYNPKDSTCCGKHELYSNNKPYNKNDEFCYAEDPAQTKNLCGGKTYTTNEECFTTPTSSTEIVYPLFCNGESYLRSDEFCSGNKKYSVCRDRDYESKGYEYAPSTQFCFRGENDNGVAVQEVKTMCGGKELDPYNEFCSADGRIIRRCNDGTGTPTAKKTYTDEQFCYEDASGNGHVETKCDGNAFNPQTQFCSTKDKKLYPRCANGSGLIAGTDGEYNPLTHSCCGDQTMDLKTHFCFEERQVEKCGSTVKVTYNPSTHFCRYLSDKKIYPICGGNDNYGADKFCHLDKLYTTCANGEYDPIKQFCYRDPTISNPILAEIGPRDRCGGKEYDLGREFCDSDKIYTKCNGQEYVPSKQFCENNQVTEMCGGLKFNTAEQFCDRHLKVYDKCGVKRDRWYDADNELCFENEIYSKNCTSISLKADFCPYTDVSRTTVTGPGYSLCGKNNFDVDKKFCFSDVIYNLCKNLEYDPTLQFCDLRDKVKDLCRVAERDPLGNIIKFTLTPFDTDEKQCDQVEYAIVDKGSDQVCPSSIPTGSGCCFGQLYDESVYFCDKNVRYPKCPDPDAYVLDPDLLTPGMPLTSDPAYISHISQNHEYIPADYICYQGISLKPSCTSQKLVTGPCAYSNSLLRCKQLGNGSNYIIDPLPGMECQSNGAIISITGSTIQNNVKYKIAQIGKQIWIAENLNNNSSTNGRCDLNSSYPDCTKYGYLYDWAAAMKLGSECNSKSKDCPPEVEEAPQYYGICPKGFAIPTRDDWKDLIDYAGGAKVAAGRLKAAAPDWNGTDDYGFKALPGGYDINWGSSGTEPLEEGNRSIWWTYNWSGSYNAYYIDMISADTEVRTGNYRLKDGGAYVRCVREGAF
jgi:uncharacterized protein (TIGR02145 family)